MMRMPKWLVLVGLLFVGRDVTAVGEQAREVVDRVPAPATSPPVPPGCTKPADLSGRKRPPPYPQIAKVMGWEGSTDLQFTVEADGRVRQKDITILRSSGTPTLDGAALTFLMEYRFQPGACAGAPQPMPHVYRVTFRLEAAMPGCVSPRLADGEPLRAPGPAVSPDDAQEVWVDVVFMVDPQGQAVPAQMLVAQSSGDRKLDFAALEFVQRRRFEPMRCAGVATAAQMGYRVKFEPAR